MFRKLHLLRMENDVETVCLLRNRKADSYEIKSLRRDAHLAEMKLMLTHTARARSVCKHTLCSNIKSNRKNCNMLQNCRMNYLH